MVNGSAYIDNWCSKCVEGNTGVPRCSPVLDCNSVPDGTAYKDNCGICVGGNTGKKPCADCTTSTLALTTSTTSNSATAVATGGQSPYNFVWSNGSTNNTATNLTTGTYIVIVSDAMDCVKTGEVYVSVNSPFKVLIDGFNWEPSKYKIYNYTAENSLYFEMEDNNYKFRGWIYNFTGIGIYSFPTTNITNKENYFKLYNKSTNKDYNTFCVNVSQLEVVSKTNNIIKGNFTIKLCPVGSGNVINLTLGEFEIPLTTP